MDIEVLFTQAERHQTERREWRDSDLAVNAEANKKHQHSTLNVFNVLLARFLVEFAILVVLIIQLFA